MVQRRRLLAYNQKTMVRVHPGLLPGLSQTSLDMGRAFLLSRQPADHLGSEPGMLWVRIPPEQINDCPRGVAWSARHPVTVEIVGSNPIEDAERDAVRNLAKRQSSNLCDSVGSTPTRVTVRRAGLVGARPDRPHSHLRVGRALACPGGCNPPARGHWRFNSVPTQFRGATRSSSGSGSRPLKPATRVRIPHGLLVFARPPGGESFRSTLSSACFTWPLQAGQVPDPLP